MKNCVYCAYFTLLMVSIISSCLLFLLVASESTKIRQNIEKNENLVNTNQQNDNVYDYNENSDSNIIQNNDKIESDSSDKSDLNKNNVVFLETISKNSGITENELPEIPAPVHVTLVDNPQQIIENAIDENLENVLKLQSHNFSIRKLNEIPPIAETATAQNDKLILDNRIIVQEEITEEEDLFNDSGGSVTNDPNMETTAEGTPIPGDEGTNGTEEHPIPVFSEWAQKHMAEAEKLEKQESVSNLSSIKKNATVKQPNVKLRAKNYASPDCGAKIIASNPEAQSTSSVLSTSKDEYMLNPCQSRIWFVVELCEPIRAEKIELANFELFSSSPKQFSVGVSNRYPTRDWSIVGQFTATDERDIQKFKLHPHLFGKFIKVEIHSHYSSEHFCPISLFSVYGTSEFEAFATENEPLTHNQDEDDEDDEDEKVFMADNNLNTLNSDNNRKDNPNILKSASEAVMSIVKKAAEVLTPKSNENNPNALNNFTQLKENNYIGYTPNYEITCRDCSTKLIIQIRNIVEFNYYGLLKLLNSKTIYNALTKTDICSNFINSSTTVNYKSYVTGILSIEYVSALCNILFNGNLTEVNRNIIIDKRNENSDQNTSEIIYNNLTLNDKMEIAVDGNGKKRIPDIPDDVLFPNDDILADIGVNDQTIDPTKTLERLYETTIEAPPTTDPTLVPGDLGSTVPSTTVEQVTDEPRNSEPPGDIVTNPADHIQESQDLSNQAPTEEVPVMSTDSNEINGNTLTDTTSTTSSPITTQSDSGSGELNVDTFASTNGNQAVAPSANQKAQSESVFLRLSTRIKALERNLSLSEQYLEELSRRYKKQVEELQQSFSKVLLTIEDQNRRNTERETLLMDQNARLHEEMEEIREKVNSRINFYIIGFIIFEVFLICLIRTCGRNRRIETHVDNKGNEIELEKLSNNRSSFLRLFKRRKSLENLNKNQKEPQISRRLSEEALQTYGEYNELLISNGAEDEDCVQIIDSRDGVNIDRLEKKKTKSRNRKNSSQKLRANSAEPNGKNPKIRIVRHESAPGKPITINGDGIRTEYINNIDVNDSVLLEENDEFYMPNMDLALNEFMPDGPSFRQQNNSNNNTSSGASSSSLQTTHTNDSNIILKPIKFRRLSSPGFLKTALGRTSTKKSSSLSPSSNHEQTTGWEWYKLAKKSNNSSTSTTSSTEPKNHKKSKSDLHLKTSNSGNTTNGFNSNTAPSVIVANDSANNTSNIKTPSSKTKSGNFKKLFKKVF